MNRILLFLFLVLILPPVFSQSVTGWVTTPDRRQLLARQPAGLHFSAGDAQGGEIVIDESHTGQAMEGFGFALTGGSADLLAHMDSGARTRLLNELFGQGPGSIGVSYLRVSIGASDLNAKVFTYNDRPPGTTDSALSYFSLWEDRKTLIPVLKEILAIDPRLRILASPWSAPAWMKTNQKMKGGSLKKEYYGAYARYFVKYLRAMQEAGITISAVTIQNEPLNEGNTPSMYFPADDEGRFIKLYLGPMLRQERLHTGIILFDHNCDHPDYPISILEDPETYPFVAGSGFHLYAGHIDALTEVHNRFPAKPVYFTEQMVIDEKGFDIGAQVERLIIGATRNWSRNVLLWNLAADKNNEPHSPDGGCTMCEGALTIDGNAVQRNLAYYVIAHASRFVPPGSLQLRSSQTDGISDVVFRTPAGRTVLILANNTLVRQPFSLLWNDKRFSSALDAGAAATYVW